ncbi:MAG: YdbL family protein [Thermodesulfovibrionales bacterium]|nr:YdbL family protein [Thermodesulfovibrionales bacterium]
MKLKRLSLFLPLIVIACVTVNIYFPASAVQKAADEIVEEIRIERSQKKIEPKKDEKPKQEGSLFRQSFKSFLFVNDAYAQQINIEVSTPAIRALKESMKGRYQYLYQFYQRGAIGENMKGYLEERDIAQLNLKERADVRNLIQQENRDRQSLYLEIISANRFGQEVLPQVERIFANSWRAKSQAGWWIQDDNGQWRRK